MTNHLGNVLTAISDSREAVPNGNQNDYFKAVITSVTDYYPFGMNMPARSYSSNAYRFGFNGKENDNEVKGSPGTQQDYGFRIYDPRLAKFLSVDPLSKNYAFYSPFTFSGNNPIAFVDLDGLERYYAADGAFVKQVGENNTIVVVTDDKVELSYNKASLGSQAAIAKTILFDDINTSKKDIKVSASNVPDKGLAETDLTTADVQVRPQNERQGEYLLNDYKNLRSALEHEDKHIQQVANNVPARNSDGGFGEYYELEAFAVQFNSKTYKEATQNFKNYSEKGVQSRLDNIQSELKSYLSEQLTPEFLKSAGAEQRVQLLKSALGELDKSGVSYEFDKTLINQVEQKVNK